MRTWVHYRMFRPAEREEAIRALAAMGSEIAKMQKDFEEYLRPRKRGTNRPSVVANVLEDLDPDSAWKLAEPLADLSLSAELHENRIAATHALRKLQQRMLAPSKP